MRDLRSNLTYRRAVAIGTLAALGLVVLGSPAPASAQGTGAVQSLPGCTANTLPPGDDNSSELQPLGFTANFFGRSFDGVYVNQNGNVTFESALGTFTPFDLTSTATPIIAPFFADVDTTPVQSGKATYGQTTVDGRPAFCVNWINVGYYSQGIDKLNSFQLLLISQDPLSGDFDIIFNYDRVQWETGNASGGQAGLGGSSAAVGFSSGDQDPAHLFVQPGSYQNGALLDGNPATGLINGSRGTPQLGRYLFAVRNRPSTPQLGESVNVGVVRGTVLVNTPGAGGFLPLEQLTQVPVGSLFDTRRGRIRLISARNQAGATQRGLFAGTIFKVTQGRRSRGFTALRLMGGNFRVCARSRGVSAARGGKRIVRRLNSSARRRGRFRTRGRYSASTVRGTVWNTTDRCDGTITSVRRGKVSVRDLVRRRTVLVRAGEGYLARAPRRR